MKERTTDIKDRVAGADPAPLGVAELDIKILAAFGRHHFKKLDREARRANHRPPHEHRVRRRAVTKMTDDRLSLQKIAVGLRRNCGVLIRCQSRLTRPRRAGSRLDRYCSAARVSMPRQSRRPARAPVSHSAGDPNASDSGLRATLR